MRHTVRRKLYKDWPTSVKRVLMGLTMKPGSGLTDMAKANCMTFVCFREDGKIVGWAAVEGCTSYSGVPDFMVYTRRNYRGRGIGAMLHRHAQKYFKRNKMFIFPCSDNEGFFKKLGYRV